MKCVFCLKEINDDLIFCPYCGRKIAMPEPEQKYMPEYETDNSRDAEPYYEAPQSQRNEYSAGNQGAGYPSQYNDNDDDDMVYYEDEFDDYTRDNDDALYYEKKSPMYNGYRNRNSRKKSTSNVWLIVLAVVLALLVTGATCWLLISALSKDSDKLPDDKEGDASEVVYTCSICKDDMDEDKKYCNDCVDKYTCKICEQISKDTENGFCDDCSVEYKCRACNTVNEDVVDGYCSDCFEDLKCKGSGCNNVITSGYYCKSCIKSNVSDANKGRCYVCNEKIDDYAVYMIDSKGRAYCKDCDTGRYCSRCSGYLTSGSQGDTCAECIQFNCAKCGRTMSKSEVVVTDSNNKTYCDNCDTGLYCESCGAPIKNNETKCKNCQSE